MAWRTPPSLKWLIVKRSRLAGSLDVIDADLKLLRSKLSQWERQRDEIVRRLAAVDTTMSLHEVQVEPSDIEPVAPHSNKPLLPHGALTRLLRKILRESNHWMTTAEIAEAVLEYLCAQRQPSDLSYVNHVVRRRLKALTRSGAVVRHLVNRPGFCGGSNS